MLSNAPITSPSGGPSLINRSRDNASAALGRFPKMGRLPAAEPGVGVMFEASLFDLPRLWFEKEGLLAGD